MPGQQSLITLENRSLTHPHDSLTRCRASEKEVRFMITVLRTVMARRHMHSRL